MAYRKTKEEMAAMGLFALSPEERHAKAVEGGLKSQALRRRKKRMQELAQIILDMKLTNADEIKAVLRTGGLDEDDITYAAGVLMVQTLKAMGGDTKAAEYIRYTSGQRPVDGLLLGNLEEKPFETINLAELSDEQLRLLIEAKSEPEEE